VLEKPPRHHAAWAVGALILFSFVGWWIVVGGSLLTQLDATTSSWPAWLQQHPSLHRTLRWLEQTFGTVGLLTLAAATAAWFVYHKHPRVALYLLACMLTPVALNPILKNWFARVRPEWQDPSALIAESTSFPSGHVLFNTVAATVAVVLASMFLRRPSLRRGAYAMAGLWVLLIVLDRLALGRHFVSDTLGSVPLGIAITAGWLALVNPLPRTTASTLPQATASDEPRVLAVVLNPVKVENMTAFQKLVTELATEAGWSEVNWFETTPEDPGTGPARAALAAGAQLVLVCGGDGTVREVCAALALTAVPVGIVPAGTGNLLARNLEIPLYLRSAIDVALSGQTKAIDLVAVSGDGLPEDHFMVMAGMGMDAAIMEGVNEDIKERVGWFAYVVSGVKSLASPAYRIEIIVDDGEPSRHRARTVVVGNVGYLQAGMPLLPDAAIDDGLLDVVILAPKRLTSWGRVAVRVVTRGKRVDGMVNRMRGASITLRASTATPRQLDGDSIGSGHELTMRCLPGQVLVRVPR
jgi:YegS/Rv2252/BmrU family lipid kinase